MWRREWKSIVFSLVLALTMVWTPAFAAEVAAPIPGSGPEVPLGLAPEWTELAPGESSWHAFYFSQPHALRAGETPEVGTVTVRMEFAPKEVGKFEILSQKEVDLWAKELKYTPIGEGTLSCGCKLSDSPRKVNWTGVPAGQGLSYILVKNPTSSTLNYRLFIDENKFVSFPAPIVTGATPAVAAALPAAPAAEPVVAATAGEWFVLQPGEETWFNLAYVADLGIKHDEDPDPVYLTLFVKNKQPICDVTFDVFTDAEYQQLIKEGEDITGKDAAKGTSIGCGTCNDTLRGDLSWMGHFNSSQTLHVRVRVGTLYSQARNIMLEASGETITPL